MSNIIEDIASSTEAQVAGQVLTNVERAYMKLEIVLDSTEGLKEQTLPREASDCEKIAIFSSMLSVLRENKRITENALKAVQSESDHFETAVRVVFEQDENKILSERFLKMRADNAGSLVSGEDRVRTLSVLIESLEDQIEECKKRLDTGVKKPIPRNPRWRDGYLSDEDDHEVENLTRNIPKASLSRGPRPKAAPRFSLNDTENGAPTGYVSNMRNKFQSIATTHNPLDWTYE